MFRIAERFDPSQPRDDHGRWTLLGAVISSLRSAGHEDAARHLEDGRTASDIRRSMGRSVTAGGSVASLHLPSRRPRPDDRVVDTRDERRLGTVATVDHAAGTMRVHWDDGTHEVRPQQSVTDPIHDPARSFDAHPLATSPAARKMAAARAATPQDQFRQHLADEVAAGRVDSRTAADAMRAAQGDHIAAAQSHVDALQASDWSMTPADFNDVEKLTRAQTDRYSFGRDSGLSHEQAFRAAGGDEAIRGSQVGAPKPLQATKSAPKTAPAIPRSERTDNERFGGVGKKALPPSKSASPRAEAIATDPALTDAEKRSRLKAMGMTPEQVDSLVPTGAKKAGSGKVSAKQQAELAFLDDALKRGESVPGFDERALGRGSPREMLAGIRERIASGQLTDAQAVDGVQQVMASFAIQDMASSMGRSAGGRGRGASPAIEFTRQLNAERTAARDAKKAAKASPAAAKMARGKAAAAPFDVADVHSRLASAQSREEGRAALEGLSVDQLKTAAKGLSVSTTRLNKTELRDALVEATVGTRVDHTSILSGRWNADRPFRPGAPAADHAEGHAATPGHSPSAPHADGLDDMQSHSLKSLGEEYLGPEARTMSASEVKAALRAQGVESPAIRQAKAASAPKAPPAGTHSEAQIVERVHAATRKLERRPGSMVSLADLRAEMPDVSREQLDRTLIRMTAGRHGVQIVPESNQKTLRPVDRDAALSIGNQDRHLIMIEPHVTPQDTVGHMESHFGSSSPSAPSSSPAVAKMTRAKAAPKAAPRSLSDVASLVRHMSSERAILEELASVKASDLPALARNELNVQLPPTARTAAARRLHIAQTLLADSRRRTGGL